MHSKLAEIVKNKEVEVAERKALRPSEILRADVQQYIGLGDGSFLAALQAPTTNLICELKPKSPSAGVLKADFKLADILPHYAAQAAAISVLTDEKYFGGSLDLLRQVAQECPLPTLCKDFVIDPYQCLEARDAGAQAVLVIVKILDDAVMKEIHDECLRLGMTPVVEVQNEAELKRALALKPQTILINNRNLDTFEISLQTTAQLAPLIPDNVEKISASGFSSRAEIESMLPYCHNFLIGSSLMAADDLRAKLSELKGGR